MWEGCSVPYQGGLERPAVLGGPAVLSHQHLQEVQASLQDERVWERRTGIISRPRLGLGAVLALPLQRSQATGQLETACSCPEARGAAQVYSHWI